MYCGQQQKASENAAIWWDRRLSGRAQRRHSARKGEMNNTPTQTRAAVSLLVLAVAVQAWEAGAVAGAGVLRLARKAGAGGHRWSSLALAALGIDTEHMPWIMSAWNW